MPLFVPSHFAEALEFSKIQFLTDDIWKNGKTENYSGNARIKVNTKDTLYT